jgi:hypothetical protein
MSGGHSSCTDLRGHLKMSKNNKKSINPLCVCVCAFFFYYFGGAVLLAAGGDDTVQLLPNSRHANGTATIGIPSCHQVQHKTGKKTSRGERERLQELSDRSIQKLVHFSNFIDKGHAG